MYAINQNNIDLKVEDAKKLQKQPVRVVLRKRCSENMQQIYKRTPMLKCAFNKVAKLHVFFGNFAAYFQNIFS